jgi:flagellin
VSSIPTNQGAMVALQTLQNANRTMQSVQSQVATGMRAAAALGAAQSRIDAQNAFLESQTQSLEIGIGAPVDADMEEASGRLQALLVRKQLGAQALSIADQQPQSILSLFR